MPKPPATSPKPLKPHRALPSSPAPQFKPREAAFIDGYMQHFNGSRAARDAGFSKPGAAVQASRMLREPKIAQEISRRRHARAENMEAITKERIEYELASVGLSNMQEMVPMFGDGDVAEKLGNLTRTQAAAVKEIVVEEFRDGRSDWRTVRRTKFKLHDKHASLELIGKMNGWIQDKVEHRHTHQGLILHSMLKEIAADQAGKPIVEIEPEPTP